MTRKTTVDIIKNLLCEARDGIRSIPMSPAQRAQSVIGFDFTFDITEQDKATSGSFDFLYPFAGGGSKFSLNVNGGAENKRQAERFVRVLNTFDELYNKKTCVDPVERANLVYPISGSIGLDEIISSYTRLRKESTLQANKNFDGAVFSDKLTYTTTLKVGLKPTIELKSIAGSFRLSKGTIDGSADRTDVHKVTIAIATTKAGQETSQSTARGIAVVRRAASPGTTGDAAAVVNELDRLRSIDDDAKATLRLLQVQ